MQVARKDRHVLTNSNKFVILHEFPKKLSRKFLSLSSF